MPVYTPVDRVAERLNTTDEHLWDFEGFGWISIMEKNGTPFIRGDQEYRAKFILGLEQVLKLNRQEISAVLFAEEPPYSFDDVDRILAETQGGKRHARDQSHHKQVDRTLRTQNRCASRLYTLCLFTSDLN